MSIGDDIEAFARLQAALQRPFSVRSSLLEQAGFEERGLREAQAKWSERFMAPDGAVWRERYRVAFERAATAPAEPATYQTADVDTTWPAIVRAEETLPFAAPLPGVVPAAVVALKGAAQKEPVMSSDGEETMWLPPPVKEGDR